MVKVVSEQSLGRLRSSLGRGSALRLDLHALVKPSRGAPQYADSAALGPAGALRGSTTVVLSGNNWRLLLLSAISLASKYMDDDHLCFVQLLRMYSSHGQVASQHCPRSSPVCLLRARLAAALRGVDTRSH